MHETGRGIAGGGSGGVRRAVCTGFGLVLLLALASVPAGRSQTPGQNVGPPGYMRPYYPERHNPIDNTDDYEAVLAERRLNALNIERQKEMVSDANKLLKLAKELRDEVASSKSDSFTPDQLHKIAEIEKLARSVRQRMAEGVGPAQPPPPLVQSPLGLPDH